MNTRMALSAVGAEQSHTRSRLNRTAEHRLLQPDATGYLLWAFHEGFAAYVSRLADGRIDVDGGVNRGDDGQFVFPLETVSLDPALASSPFGSELETTPLDPVFNFALDTAPFDPAFGPECGPSLDPAPGAWLDPSPHPAPAGDGSMSDGWRCSGAVHFTGHHGLLAVSLAAPAVMPAASGDILTIADPFTPGQRMVLAELGVGTAGDGPGEGISITRYAEPRLTEAGADLFFGRYREGMPLAPLEVFDASPVSASLVAARPFSASAAPVPQTFEPLLPVPLLPVPLSPAPPSPAPPFSVPAPPAPSASAQHSPDQDTSDD